MHLTTRLSDASPRRSNVADYVIIGEIVHEDVVSPSGDATVAARTYGIDDMRVRGGGSS